ncbi:MAG TPA: uracil-DNA glycosylase [Candidatus Binatia bacterium]|nr:uracil-DNA glycosylase [Candidatus Binatia bacterium]
MSPASDVEELAALTNTLKRHLERRQRAGLRFLPKASPVLTQPVVPNEIANVVAGPELDMLAETSVAVQAASLEDLRSAIGDCQRCKLCAGRTNLVFGVGNPRARLMFVGEGPGRDEDLKGEPFVGRAGQLLTDIITKGMGLRREDVYICNVVKCRPPENRNPEPDEVAACEPFLKKQIDIIGPDIIVGLGKFAVQTLLNSKVPISKLRGVWASYHDIKLMPTFHPAYLLRNPADKKLVWEDIKQVINVMRGENA